MPTSFSETDEFAKAFKRLSKKYLSLQGDLAEFKKILSELPLGSGRHSAVLAEGAGIKVVKARLFCRYLRGSSLRVVYGYREADRHIAFIELYFKGEQEKENRKLIEDFLK